MSDKKEEIKAVESAPQSAKPAPAKPKKAAKKPDKPNVFVRMGRFIGRKCKEMFSELKKVTWPSFPTVLRQTGVVLVVVLLFLVLVFAFDSVLSLAYTLLK